MKIIRSGSFKLSKPGVEATGRVVISSTTLYRNGQTGPRCGLEFIFPSCPGPCRLPVHVPASLGVNDPLKEVSLKRGSGNVDHIET